MITIQEYILINSHKEQVWKFTQDFDNRTLWDHSIHDYKIIQKKPIKMIWIKMKGGTNSILKYKLCDKPNKTSLRMYQTQSLFIRGGGGSWKYEEKDGWTRWEQTNTLELKNNLVFWLFGAFIKRKFKKDTIKAMKKAKLFLEKET